MDNIEWSKPVILKSRRVHLAPTIMDHLDGLCNAILTGVSWHIDFWPLNSRQQIEAKILNEAILGRKQREFNCFTIQLAESQEIVGMTSLRSFNQRHSNLEIGASVVGSKWQRTFVNTEAKGLLLKYCFEDLKVNRVFFNVDSLNFKSHQAVLRLGAKYEGELRHSWIQQDGVRRDRKIYSILDFEWPSIQKHLNWLLKCHDQRS
ncbi:MAG: GNAT family protein [Proteobacteria bacterium]|nr:GNAT family protein [Pseudomonadota bacterium]